MLLDKLLSNIDVHVDYLSLCLLSSGWRLRLPGPPDVMLHFVLQGRGTVRGPENRAYPLAPCWLAIVPKGAAHRLESGGEVKHERRIDVMPKGVRIPPSLVAGSSEHPDLIIACGIVRVRYGKSLGVFDQLRDVLAVDMSDCPQVQAALEGIIAEQSEPGYGSEAMKGALMTECLVHLFRCLARARNGTLPWIAALDDPRLARVVNRILDHPAAHHTVDSLAEIASMSRSAFAQHFAEAFGYPPMNLVRLVRMQSAADLLAQEDLLSIDAVANRVGFSSRSQFSRAFKSRFNCSPSAYRAARRMPDKSGQSSRSR